MRSSPFGLCEMRSFLIMALINLGRYKEACEVIVFWMIKFPKMDSGIVAEMINNLQPGEWLHSANPNDQQASTKYVYKHL